MSIQVTIKITIPLIRRKQQPDKQISDFMRKVEERAREKRLKGEAEKKRLAEEKEKDYNRREIDPAFRNFKMDPEIPFPKPKKMRRQNRFDSSFESDFASEDSDFDV